MRIDIPLLQNVKVAAPCSASWDAMSEVDGDKVHFCDGCKKNVYNLSALTQNQAEGLLRKHEGHLCVRYFQRTDGTILTQNCSVGLAAVRAKMIARSKTAAFLTASLVAAFAANLVKSGHSGVVTPVADVTMGEIIEDTHTMGKAAIVPPPVVPLMGALDYPLQTHHEVKGEAEFKSPAHSPK